jgi:hypothetical protein
MENMIEAKDTWKWMWRLVAGAILGEVLVRILEILWK